MGHSGRRSSFELQINQGPLFGGFHSVQGHPDYTRLKCAFECVCMQRDLRGGGGGSGVVARGGLSLVGLAYNSDRARELKAAQRYDGQAKWSPLSAVFE